MMRAEMRAFSLSAVGTLAVRARRLEQSGQALPADPFHGQVEDPALFTEIEDLADVRMVDAGSEPRFIQEHRLEGIVAGERGQDGLDGDGLAETALSVLLGRPNACHAAFGNPHEHFVASEPCARTDVRRVR